MLWFFPPYLLLNEDSWATPLCCMGKTSNCFLLLPIASMMPQRKSDLCKLVVRALFTGACVSFISACMAGRCLRAVSGRDHSISLRKFSSLTIHPIVTSSIVLATPNQTIKNFGDHVPSLPPSRNACLLCAGILYVPRGAEADCVSFLSTGFTNRTYETYVCCRELFHK